MPRMRPGKTSGMVANRSSDPASGRPPHRQPRRQESERHRQRRSRHRDQQRVGDQPDMIGREHGAIIVERDAGERRRADGLIERQQRNPGEHRDRHGQEQQEIEHENPRRRIAQPPEVERARPEALAGDGREPLRVPRQPAVDGEQHQHQHEHQDRERAGAADIGGRLCHHVAVDVGGQNGDAARQPHQRRNLERLDGADEDQHRQRQDGRQREPQGHPPDGHPDAGAAHARGFLQLRIGVAQRRAHQEERQRRPQEALDHDHAGHGIDVDQKVGGAGNAAVELIDRAGLAEQQQPRRHIKNVRRAERDDRGEIGQRLERRIGALDDPGGGPSDRQRDHRAAGREHERVGAGGKEAPTPQHRFEIGQAPFAAALRVHDTGFEQKHERRQHQRGEHDDQDRRKQRASGKRRDGTTASRSRDRAAMPPDPYRLIGPCAQPQLKSSLTTARFCRRWPHRNRSS